MSAIIEVKGLKKNYGHLAALKEVSFSVEKGSLFSYLGPNGSGKSTTVGILSTLLPADGGIAIINGLKVGRQDARIRDAIGVVFQDHVLDPLLTVRENLNVRAGLYFKRRLDKELAVKRVAEQTGLEEFLNRPYGRLSGGQRRRADVARALLSRPAILFLDEPTTGLDPQTRKNIWEAIRKLREDYLTTVFLTTHYMEEAAESDFITVIDQGNIVAQGTPTALKLTYTSDTLHIISTDDKQLCLYLEEQGWEYHLKNGTIIVQLEDSKAAIPLLSAVADLIASFEVVHGTMDDVFIGITGKEINEDV